MGMHIANGILALAFGAAVATGTFALLLVIGVVSRFIGRLLSHSHILVAENAIVCGVIYGAIYSVIPMPVLWRLLGHLILCIAGVCFGIFVGSMAAALAEILHTFPILFRRFRLKKGLPWVMGCMAFGKMAGSFFYFLMGYGA